MIRAGFTAPRAGLLELDEITRGEAGLHLDGVVAGVADFDFSVMGLAVDDHRDQVFLAGVP